MVTAEEGDLGQQLHQCSTPTSVVMTRSCSVKVEVVKEMAFEEGDDDDGDGGDEDDDKGDRP